MAEEAIDGEKESVFATLNGADKIILAFAVILLIAGLYVLGHFCMFLWMRFDVGQGFSAETTGQVGDFIGGTVGTLFALSGVVLFFLAVMIQSRELRQSIQETRHLVAGQAAMLRVALEEKEFRICSETMREYRLFVAEEKGYPGIRTIINQWAERFSAEFVARGRWKVLSSADSNTILDKHLVVHQILLRLQWLCNATKEKTLSVEDRSYMNLVINRDLLDVTNLILPSLHGAAWNSEILSKHSSLIDDHKLDRALLNECHGKITLLLNIAKELQIAPSL